MDVGFDRLVQETFELSTKMTNKNPFEEEVECEVELTPDTEEEFDIPEGPGLIFYIDKGRGTYCVRGNKTESILDSLEEIVQGKPDALSFFRLKFSENLEEIQFFPTGTVERAEVIRDHLFNRRFPYEEEVIYNLSDPGFSWWLDAKEGELTVHFRSHGVDRAQELFKLGPIGDGHIAIHRLNQSINLLQEDFAIKFYESSDKGFTIRTAETTKAFQDFHQLLAYGEITEELERVFESCLNETDQLFFSELACTRQFWIKVEGIIQGQTT